MSSIVTGASGFIGKALLAELLEQQEVTAVIRPGSPKRQQIEQMFESKPAYAGRLRILELPLSELGALAEQYHVQADVFYHLAWNGSSGSDREDFDMQYSNIRYTAEALTAAKACGCQKFVGAGSQAEYGVIRGKAREDSAVPKPFMMYGAVKLAACQMGRVLADQIGISFVWPRIYSVYGVGENPGTLVNYLIDSLNKGEVPELSPCENMWNFLYITDCARALRLLGSKEDTEGIYHIASGDTRLLKDFAEEIRDIIYPEAELGFGKKKSDPARTFWLEPDTERLKALGFRCEISFQEGIMKKLGESQKD